MLNINAFWHVVHEKVSEDLSKYSLFCPLLGPQKRPAPLFEQIWIPILQACFLPSLVEIGQVVLEKKIFCAFPYIILCKSLSPWGGAIHDPRDLIWTNLNLLAPRVLHTIYQCIPAGGSWEEGLSKLCLLCPLLGPKRGQPLYLNKSESPIPQACFLPCLVEIHLEWFLRSRLKEKVDAGCCTMA